MRTSLIAVVGSLLLASAASAADAPDVLQGRAAGAAANCQSCHRPGEVAPMSLLTYEQARPWARAIKNAIATKQMPPWFADPAYGHLRNERRLIAREIETINALGRRGAPAGNPSDAPPALMFENGWNIKPDIVVEMPKAFEIPASRHDQLQVHRREGRVHRRPVGDRRRNAARQSRGAAPRQGVGAAAGIEVDGEGGARRSLRARESHREIMGDNAIEEGNDILGKFNPGLGAQRFDIDGAAKFIPKGSDLVFELHYTTSGEPTPDVSKLGLVLAKQPPKTRYFFHAGPTAMNLAIPAGEGNAEVVSEITFGENARLVYAQPHMHLRGKDFELRVVSPDRKSTTVLKGNWNFEWQMGYQFAEPIALPKGAKLQLVTHFDNSPANRFNPDRDEEGRVGPSELG